MAHTLHDKCTLILICIYIFFLLYIQASGANKNKLQSGIQAYWDSLRGWAPAPWSCRLDNTHSQSPCSFFGLGLTTTTNKRANLSKKNEQTSHKCGHMIHGRFACAGFLDEYDIPHHPHLPWPQTKVAESQGQEWNLAGASHYTTIYTHTYG